jgi:hypothetical protein
MPALRISMTARELGGRHSPLYGATQSDAQVLLDLVTHLDRPKRVILDMGVQVLNSNVEMTRRWLAMLTHHGPIQAGIFVNDQDSICVMNKSGRVEFLQTSPLVSQTEACLVFLDEAHTRGIDLKLRVDYRAAVTWPGDHQVQAGSRFEL